MTSSAAILASLSLLFVAVASQQIGNSGTQDVTSSSSPSSSSSSSNDWTNLALRKMAHASIQFAWDSYLALDAPAGRNVFFSPYSVMNALGMLKMASSGTTASQLRSALRLHPSTTDVELHEGLADENAKLRGDVVGNTATFGVANRFFVDDQTAEDIDPDYVAELNRVYNASMSRTPFSTDPRRSRDIINRFISDNTAGHINNFLTSVPDPTTNVMLVNAIYFKGLWTSPFRKQFTKPRAFHAASDVTCDFMYQRMELPYTFNDDLGCEMFCLTYSRDQRYGLYVVLPQVGLDLSALEKRLDAVPLLILQNSLNLTRVEIRFPKFALAAQLSLRRMLDALGAPDIFDPLAADYSRMFVASRPGMIVDDVVHEAKVQVDEEGTVASAATSVIGLRNNDLKRSIVVDRPFLFFIADQSNGFILFYGRVADPTQT